MQTNSRWLFWVLTGCLLGSPFFAPLRTLHAAPAQAESEVAVNINRANASDLELVRGIGPMLAERIVKDREANGRYERLEDLIRVPGIGPAKFEKIKSQITL